MGYDPPAVERATEIIRVLPKLVVNQELVVPWGSPAAVMLIGWLNPLIALALTPNEAEPGAVTIADCGDTLSEKSGAGTVNFIGPTWTSQSPVDEAHPGVAVWYVNCQ
jgi:hypothetical protein